MVKNLKAENPYIAGLPLFVLEKPAGSCIYTLKNHT